MKSQFRPLIRVFAILLFALPAASLPSAAIAQSKEVITFAAVTFSEAGRGDRLKAWVDKFNKSQSAIEVQPVALPFSSFAKTIFTQMGGGEGPDLVRFDQIDYYAAVAANRILQLDEAINDRDYKFTAPDKYLKVGGKALWHAIRDQQLRPSVQPDAAKGWQGTGQFRRVHRNRQSGDRQRRVWLRLPGDDGGRPRFLAGPVQLRIRLRWSLE